jgi:hypothetical protein
MKLTVVPKVQLRVQFRRLIDGEVGAPGDWGHSMLGAAAATLPATDEGGSVVEVVSRQEEAKLFPLELRRGPPAEER